MSAAQFAPLEVKNHIFEPGKNKDYWKCKLCPKEIKCKEGAGYTNQKMHASNHSNINEILQAAIDDKKRRSITALGFGFS